ncbi:MAG: hypothetical protein ACSW8B_00180 [bacterium]
MFFLAYFYHRSLKLEYEYTLIDDDFSIDKIIAKMKRKKMAFFNLVDLVDITVEDDAFEQKYGSLKHKTKRFVSKCHDDPEYVLVLRRGGRYTYVHIQADEQLLKALKTRHVTVFHVDGI